VSRWEIAAIVIFFRFLCWRIEYVFNACRNLGAYAHAKEILVAPHYHSDVAFRGLDDICSKFSPGAVYLHDLLVL
jgi:hypothetical protein